MSSKFRPKDYTNKIVGHITIIENTGKQDIIDGSYIWKVQCDCGKVMEKSASRFARIFSCGCKKRFNSGRKTPLDLSSYKNELAEAVEPTNKRCKSTGNTIWKMKCACGNIFEIPSYALTRRTVKSCGCKIFMPKGRQRIPNNGSHVNTLYSNYSRSASVRGIEFSIPKKDARELFESICYYCGEPPSISYTHKNLSKEYAWNGIDRVNPRHGYHIDNCVPCCSRCNWAKGSMNIEQFICFIKAVSVNINKISTLLKNGNL